MNSAHTGIEKLVALASLSPDWRKKVLADPLAASSEADLELSENERAIIASVPRATLEQMIDRITENVASAGVEFGARPGDDDIEMVSLGHMPDEPPPIPMPRAPTSIRPDMPSPRTEDSSGDPVCLKAMSMGTRPDTPVTGMRSDLPKKGCTALAALAALGAAGTCALSSLSVSRGNRPDIPYSNRHRALTGIDKLNQALAASGHSKTPVIAVFYHPAPPQFPAKESDIIKSQDLCTFRSPGLVAAVQTVQLTVVHIDDPWVGVKGKKLSDADAENYEALEDPYEATLEKYGIKGKLPAVVFLAPDGTALQTLIRPTDEQKLVQSLRRSGEPLEAWKKSRKQAEELR